MYSSKV